MPQSEWRLLGELTIRGIPVAQGRPRGYVRANGKAGVYDDGRSRGWKAAIIAEAMRAKLPREAAGPIRLSIEFEMPRPKRLREEEAKPHTNVPDLDNLVKAVMDALGEYRLWSDDRQVCELEASKWYHAGGSEPHAIIVVDQLVG